MVYIICIYCKYIYIVFIRCVLAFSTTFGGMWRWRRVAVARVFELVVRCRIMMLFIYSRVGKNRDTSRESPAGAGAGRTADHLTVLFSQNILAVRRGNDIYRPARGSAVYLINLSTISFTEIAVSRYSRASFSSGM
jgi:hypothetical protein